jgi:hypothetical protein
MVYISPVVKPARQSWSFYAHLKSLTVKSWKAIFSHSQKNLGQFWMKLENYKGIHVICLRGR